MPIKAEKHSYGKNGCLEIAVDIIRNRMGIP